MDTQSRIIAKMHFQDFHLRAREGGRGYNIPIAFPRDGFVVVVKVLSDLRGVLGITRKPPQIDMLPSLLSSGTE